MINFVTNLPQNLRTGGFSAINAAAFSALSKRFIVRYAGPINPPVVLPEKILSKLLRLAGARGDFFFFSQRRLSSIATQVRHQCSGDARLDFFHGFTPWILSNPHRPYIAWSDCSFRDYIDIYHSRSNFSQTDLKRIETAEALWLQKAELVLFTSSWAANRARQAYGLEGARVATVGIFGELEMPPKDEYSGGSEFAFVATDFERKGGRVVLEAFRHVRQKHPEAKLIVVGEQPADLTNEPGLEFAGFLRKEYDQEFDRYRKILGRVRAVVNATRSDISPLLPIEAGYFGCPTISSRRYAIPELVTDGLTGILVDDVSNPKGVVQAMNWMLESDDAYLRMRRAAWVKTRGEHSKDRFENNLIQRVAEVLGEEPSAL